MGILNRDYMRSGRGIIPEGWGPVQIIIALNVVVFVGWMIANASGSRLFHDHFMTSNAHLERGFVWTLVTAAFSHKTILHIFFNMFVLFMFGRAIESNLGTQRFWRFYLGASIFASLVHVGICYIKGPVGMLGASGATAALVTMFAFYHPREKLYLFMVVPMPAWVLVALMSVFDLYGLFAQLQGGGGNIGHAAHLGGVAFAVGYWWISSKFPGRSRRRRRSRRRQREAEAQMSHERRRQEARSQDEEQMDRILEQISRRGGYDKLPESEREVLEDLSRRLRKDQ